MANFCSMCGGTAAPINYAKQVDPPIQPYGTILGDSPSNNNRQPQRDQMPCIQMCLPTVTGYDPPTSKGGSNPQSSIIQVPCDPVKPCPEFICEPCPPPSPTKIWLIKSSPTPQKSACLPVGGSCNQCPVCPSSPAKLLICLPCPPPASVSQNQQNTNQVYSFPFAVPQKLEGEEPKHIFGGKYLPPPERKICPPHCIHTSDIKGQRACTWWGQIPCIAHCFETPLRKS